MNTFRSSDGSGHGAFWRFVIGVFTIGVASLSVQAAAPPPTFPVVIGLGDSVMAGTNCGCRGIVADYSRAAGKAQKVALSGLDYSVNGETTDGLLQQLTSEAQVRQAVSRSSVVLISIGANDLSWDAQEFEKNGCDATCYAPDVADMKTRLSRSLTLIHQLRKGAATQVFVFAYWNLFQDGQVAKQENSPAFNQFAEVITDAANTAICSSASAAKATCIDLKTIFRGRSGDDLTDLLASDGDHPNAAGVNLIVESLVKETKEID